jgi:phage-related holin
MSEQSIVWLKQNAPLFYVFLSWIMTIAAAVGLDPLIVVILGVSFALDYAFGVLASFKTKSFTYESGLVGFLAKLLGIGLVICISLLLKITGINHHASITFFFTMLSINDLLSALRHWYTIRTGKVIKQYDAISELIRGMHTYLKKLVGVMIKKVDENDQN